MGGRVWVWVRVRTRGVPCGDMPSKTPFTHSVLPHRRNALLPNRIRCRAYPRRDSEPAHECALITAPRPEPSYGTTQSVPRPHPRRRQTRTFLPSATSIAVTFRISSFQTPARSAGRPGETTSSSSIPVRSFLIVRLPFWNYLVLFAWCFCIEPVVFLFSHGVSQFFVFVSSNGRPFPFERGEVIRG